MAQPDCGACVQIFISMVTHGNTSTGKQQAHTLKDLNQSRKTWNEDWGDIKHCRVAEVVGGRTALSISAELSINVPHDYHRRTVSKPCQTWQTPSFLVYLVGRNLINCLLVSPVSDCQVLQQRSCVGPQKRSGGAPRPNLLPESIYINCIFLVKRELQYFVHLIKH